MFEMEVRYSEWLEIRASGYFEMSGVRFQYIGTVKPIYDINENMDWVQIVLLDVKD